MHGAAGGIWDGLSLADVSYFCKTKYQCFLISTYLLRPALAKCHLIHTNCKSNKYRLTALQEYLKKIVP